MEKELFDQEPEEAFIARLEDETSYMEGLAEAAEAAKYDRIARLTGTYPF